MFDLVPMSRGFMAMPRVFKDVESAFDNLFNESLLPELTQSVNPIKLDIRENEKEYILEADLPGLKKEDLQLEFNNNRLSISVKKDEEHHEEKENYLRKERRSQFLSRVIPFSGVKEEGIKANYENGVLQVTLPKMEAPTEKKHQIYIE